MGGEGAHGMLILSPRAVERLESFSPENRPLPKIFQLAKKGKLDEALFTGATPRGNRTSSCLPMHAANAPVQVLARIRGRPRPSTSRPRRRRDSPPRNIRVAAAASPRPPEYPRDRLVTAAGATINTPSMVCVEDYLDALAWAESLGGLPALMKRSEANLKAVADWVDATPWAHFLAKDAATRSNTSVCLTLDTDPDVVKKICKLLEDKNVAYRPRRPRLIRSRSRRRRGRDADRPRRRGAAAPRPRRG